MFDISAVGFWKNKYRNKE